MNSNVRLASQPCPLTFTRAAGSRIWDIDGNEYIDFAMGMGPHILGHNSPAVIEAVRKSLEFGQLFGGQSEYETRLAEILVSIIPWIEQVRIGISGTEMNLLALRIARAYTGRQKIVRFAGHYHGWLDPLFVSPVGSPPMSMDSLTLGQSRAAASDVILLDWNDVEQISQTLQTDKDIAAVIMEPIMCNSGLIQPKPGYLEFVRDACNSAGAVLIIDEVITGFRVGLTGAQGHLGVHGDISIYAKAIGSGFPVAALGGSVELLANVGNGKINHSGTYNTGVTAMVAACATLQELRRVDPFSQITAIGQSLIKSLTGLRTASGSELQAEGPGAMFQLRFGPNGGITDLATSRSRSDAHLLSCFIRAWQDQGVRTTSRGLCFVSSAHSESDIDFVLEAAKRALATV
ncbi:MAG: aspartate aminotransferase family protein [Ilumatobacteraceae bacterium]